VSDEDLMPGKTEVHGDVEAVPVAVMVARQLDDDVTGDDAVEEVLELLCAKPDMGGQRVRVRHASDRELKGDLHGTTSFLRRKQVSCARAPGGSRRILLAVLRIGDAASSSWSLTDATAICAAAPLTASSFSLARAAPHLGEELAIRR
jgi:hypothetical protein